MKFYYVTNIFDVYIFDDETTALIKFFLKFDQKNAFYFFIFYKWKKCYSLTFSSRFNMYCCALC